MLPICTSSLKPHCSDTGTEDTHYLRVCIPYTSIIYSADLIPPQPCDKTREYSKVEIWGEKGLPYPMSMPSI